MFKKIMNVLSVVVLVLLIVVVLFSLMTRIMGNTPSIFGYYIFNVSSDSMEPTLMVGDVILVESVDAEEIHKDDIITYKSTDGSMYGRNVTHRVVTEPEQKRGTYYYQTQGDAKYAPLDKKITYDQVQGKYVRKLTLIGKFYSFISKPVGVVTFLVIIVLLFGYEMISLMVSNKKIDETDGMLDDLAKKKTKESKKDDEKKDEKKD